MMAWVVEGKGGGWKKRDEERGRNGRDTERWIVMLVSASYVLTFCLEFLAITTYLCPSSRGSQSVVSDWVTEYLLAISTDIDNDNDEDGNDT